MLCLSPQESVGVGTVGKTKVCSSSQPWQHVWYVTLPLEETIVRES